MVRRPTGGDWLLMVLAVAVLVGMLLTLWAGCRGTIRSRHGVAGGGAPARGQVFAANGSTRRYSRVPSPSASPWRNCTDQSTFS